MLRLFLPLLASLLVSLAPAQALADPPVRVARLAYLRGPVSFSPAGTDDWALASLNRPLVAGDRLWTDAGGRDELQLGGAALRMDGGTLLSILTLDDRALQVQLSQGTLNLRVRPGPAAGAIEIDTPNLALAIEQPGHYRIDVDPAGNTTAVRVDDGQAQAMGQYQALTLNAGQAMRFGGPDLRNVQALDPRYRDDFDRWAASRDQRAERALAARYVSPAMIGYDDLDDYGTWRTVPAYGHVWIPRGIERGWAPYRDGHWAWIEPWGWTWIDDAPWGFAVTHYGRWANLDGGWAWVPEPANAMPVYAPALVAFTVVEDNLVRGRREPAVAWFPLGPRESYRPAYAASPRYIRAINYNITNVTSNAYANRHVSGAITAVPASAFTRAQPVRRAALALPRERMAQAPVLAAPEVQARHESLASHLTGGHRPAPALLARPAMTHMRPAVAHAPHQVGGAAPQFQRGPQPPAAGPLDQRLPPHLVAGVATPQFHPRDMAGRPDHMAADRGAPAVPAIPRPDHEAERRAMQMMRQPGPQAQPAAPRNWPQHGQPAPRQAHDTTAPEQHAPPMPHPPHQPPVGAPHLVNEAPALPQHPSPPYAQAHMQPAPHPVPMPAAHEPPRGQPQHAQAPAHAEPMHAPPAPHWAPPQAVHQPPPHPAPPQAAHEQPRPAPPQAAHEQPRPAPTRPVHEAPPPPAAHASPPPHQEPPHAEHAPPAQGGPHPPAAPGKDGPEHGQHGHKDEHH